MKVKCKLTLGFAVVVSFIWIVGISAIIVSKNNLENTIRQYSAASLTRITNYVDDEINSKIEYFLGRTKGATLQKTLKESNQKASMSHNFEQNISKIDRAWMRIPKDSVTPFMRSLLENDLSKSFRAEIKVFEKEYGEKLISEILATDSSGILVSQTTKASDYYQGDELWWQKAKDERVYITEFTFDESSGKHAIEICVIIEDYNGKFAGIMKAVFELENLLKSIRTYLQTDSRMFEDNTKYTIFDNEGKIFFSTIGTKFLDKYPHVEKLKNLSKENNYSYEFSDSSGIDRLVFFKPMSGKKYYKGFGWTLVAEFNKDTLFSGIYSLRNQIVFSCFIITIFGIAVSLFLSGRILQPIRKLFQATKRIGDGNYNYQIDVNSTDEVGELARSFNDMSQKINESNLRVLMHSDEIQQINLNLEHEISEREKAQKDLWEEKEKLSITLKSITDAVIATDKDGKVIIMNKTAETLTGHQFHETIEANIDDIFILKESPHRNFNDILRLVTNQSSNLLYSEEATLLGCHGTEYFIANSISPILMDNGEINGIVLIFRDITEKNKIEKQLIESENKFRNLFNNSLLGIFRSTIEGNFLDINPAFARIFKYDSPQDVINSIHNISDQIYANTTDRERVLKELNEGTGSGIFQINFKAKDGQKIIGNLSISIEKDADGKMQFLEGFVEDITEKKQIEENFFKIFNKNPEWIVITNLDDGLHLNINQAYCELFEYAVDDILGKTSIDLNIWLDIEHRDSIINTVRTKGALHNVETTLRTKSGKIITCLVSFDKILYSGKECLMAIGRDITERKSAEESFFKIFHTNPESIAITSMKDGAHISVNEAYCRTFGFTAEEVIGKTIRELNMVVDIDVIERIKEIVIEDGTLKDIELKLRKKNGEITVCLLSFEKIVYKGIECLMSISRDITERKTWEESLANEKERLSVTLRSIGDGVITTDVEGKVTMLNKIAEKLTGWTQEEAKGKDLEEVFHIVHSQSRQRCENPFKKVISSDIIAELERDTMLISKDGTERIISDSGSPIKDTNSRIIGVVLVFRDITNKRKIDDELQKIQKIESIGILAGGLAHDFNNILTSIVGSLSLAQFKSNAADKDMYLKLAEEAALKAKDLTYQLLTFSKGGEPVKKLTSIENLAKMSASFAGSGSNCEISFDIQEKLWNTEIDEGQIGQVINNIIINSIQAMPKGGKIQIALNNCESKTGSELLPPGKFVSIKVSDTGPGIPKEIQNKIFDPYFTTKKKGSGLGLAISFSIIKKHSGYIEVSSEEGNGAQFTIYLPASADSISTQIELRETKINKGKGNILIMDDEESIRLIMKDILTMLGYDVTSAVDGNETIEKYTKAKNNGSPFDIVIMDLTIPGGMGGKETIEKLLKIDPWAKAIVSSGYSNDPVMADYKKYGFMGTIAKPYRVAEVSKVIRSITNPN